MDLKALAERLEALAREVMDALAQAASLREVEELRVRALGRKGALKQALAAIGELPPEARKEAGRIANAVKERLVAAVEEARARVEALERRRRIEAERIDPTLPGRRPPAGGRHLLSASIERMVAIFRTMGFAPEEGPEIETEAHNFDDLNIPPEHPARAMHDTFFLRDLPGFVLRTHTSPVQIRAMRAWVGRGMQPPLAVVAAGRVFRCDEDATHSPMFHQIEGFAVDRRVSLAHLKWTLRRFLEAWFERTAPLRLRPSYFPFTEPSVEVDIGCLFCEGRGCRVCKGTGWLEVLGAGMIHPRVLENAGIPSERFSGFAFGLGVERLVMLKYGVPDLRWFFQGDVRAGGV